MKAQQTAEILAKIPAHGRNRYVTYNGRRDWETGLAKLWGAAHGYEGREGGWIYRNDQPVRQGWYSFFLRHKTTMLDWLTTQLTASRTFQELLDAPGVYRPTLLTSGRGGWKYEILAEAFDAAQRERGNPKRAHRGRGYFVLGRVRGEFDRSWIRSEHLVNGEHEAELRAICGQKVSETGGDLTPKSFQHVTCDECKAKAGLAA